MTALLLIFDFYSNWGEILMHVRNYQQLYYTFFDLVAVRNRRQFPSFPRTALSHFSWILYQSGTCLITKDNLLTLYLHIFLVLRGLERILGFLYFFLIDPILIFKDL